MKKVRIIIFASGSGTNAENIIRYFKNHSKVEIIAVLCNKPGAKVLDRAANLQTASKVFNREEFYNSNTILEYLKNEADLIILAGFLWKIPENIIQAFPNKIINIHPALLPNYGGKGMYGMNVHHAVVENQEKESGITIHYVNQNYDEGAIIFQAKVEVLATDLAEDVAQKIHKLEQDHFPNIIEEYIINKN